MLIAATCIIAHGRSTYVLSLGECPIHSPLWGAWVGSIVGVGPTVLD